MVSYHARFKDEKKQYQEIRDELIKGFIKLKLDPDEYPVNWENYFEIKEDYMELYIDNCFGNWGNTLDYIENDFIKGHSDVMVEFVITAYYDDGVGVERILYDGEIINKETPTMETPICPTCQSFDFELIDENLYRCAVCKDEFCEEEFMYDYRYVFEIN